MTNKVMRNKNKNPFFVDFKIYDKTDNVVMKGSSSPMKDFESMFRELKKKIR